MTETTSLVIPKIGQAFPGVDGIYAGISVGLNGQEDGHLILLNAVQKNLLTWEKAMTWARSLGGGARLPTRREGALLCANLCHVVDRDYWYWTSTERAVDLAWVHELQNGCQEYEKKTDEAQCRAVVRVPLCAAI